MRLPTPRPRSSSRRAPGDVLVANANDPRVMARAAAVRRPRRDVRDRRRRRRARAPTCRHRGARRHGGRRAHAGGHGALRTPLLGPGNLAERAGGDRPWRSSSACRSTQIVERGRGGCAPAAPSRRAAAAARAASRSSTTRTTRARRRCAGARDASARDRQRRARSRCSARCSSSARTPSALHGECGRAAAAAGLELLITVGGAPAAALARGGDRRPACAQRCVSHVATQRGGGRRRRCAQVAAGRSRAREGLARHRHRPGGGSAEGGVRLMLYHLLPR